MTTNNTHNHVFISYSMADSKNRIASIVRPLRSAGLGVWYAPISSTMPFDPKNDPKELAKYIANCLLNSDQAWLAVGPEFGKRPWSQFETHLVAAAFATQKNKCFVVYFDMTEADARRSLSALGINNTDDNIQWLDFGNGIEPIVEAAVAELRGKVFLAATRKVLGPFEIAIFGKLGLVMGWEEGGLPDGKPFLTDLRGHSDFGRFDSVLETQLGIPSSSLMNLNEGADVCHSFPDEGEHVIAFLNHFGTVLDTQQEIERGVIRNLGKMYHKPIATYNAVTIAVIRDHLLQNEKELVDASFEVHHGEWTRIAINPDLKSLSVT